MTMLDRVLDRREGDSCQRFDAITVKEGGDLFFARADELIYRRKISNET